MNQLLNNRIGKQPKVRKRGCLFLILGSLLALLGTVVYILLVTYLTRIVIEARHGEETGYAIMTLVKGSWGVVMLFFYGILALWYMAPTEAEVERQNRQFAVSPGGHNQQPVKAMPRRVLWLVTGGLLLGVVATGAVTLNTYKLVTEDGVRTYCLVETGRYEWADVTAYSVNCDNSEGLSLTFSFKGGKQIEILRGVNTYTSAFRAKAYDSVTHFASELDKRLVHPEDGRPVPPRNMAGMAYERALKFYRDAPADTLAGRQWPYVRQLIGYVEPGMQPDEIVPDTTPESEAESGT